MVYYICTHILVFIEICIVVTKEGWIDKLREIWVRERETEKEEE